MKLYKYKSSSTFERDYEFLENDLIWFSKIETLNDPYEGIFSIGKENKIAYNILFPRRNQAFKNLFNATNNLVKAQNELAGILSLTTDNKNLLMWSHYGENHKGYVLEFEFKNDNFKAIGEHSSFNPKIEFIQVEYTSKPKAQNLFKNNILPQLYNKNKCWSYEREFRFITNYFGKYKYNNSCLKAIYLGANISDKLKGDFLDFCPRKNINLFQAIIPNDTFDLKFEELY